MKKNALHNRGVTLVEIVFAMAIIAAMAAIVFVAIRPAERFARARNNQRRSDIATLLNAMGQRSADNRGVFETGCTAGAVPTSVTPIASGAGNYDMGPCLVSTYLTQMPFDTKATGAHYNSTADYKTGYSISRDAPTGRVTITAPSAEVSEIISIVR
ncbi:MAG: hypothetical protein RL641_377 [Candidatus Parcubacteria bacterium]|jgi:type IV pilus assembly protein PilA